jgi:uncharacterized protein YndB with AHSA1/START domain
MPARTAVREAAPEAPEVVVISRLFDAPRALVWEAWSSHAQLARWWGPMGFTTPRGSVELRRGGPFSLVMRGPNGTEYPMEGFVREVEAPARLVWSALVHDETRVETTVTFEEEGGKTRLTVRQTVPRDPKMARGQKPGWSQSLERLATALVESNAAGASSSPTADREIATSRVFDAPRDLVWQAWTDPKHLAHWYGPNGFTVTSHEMDVRPGGVWRLTMHGPDGTDYPNLTRYVEVVRPERLVYEHGSAERDEDRFDVTVTFTDEGAGKTRVSMRMVCATRERRDRFVNVFGALQGNRQTMDRLETHLALADGPKLVLTRTFDAPRDLVWKAWTEAARLSGWWGPKGFSWAGGTMDLRPGGIFHYGLTTPDEKATMWGRFVYREVVEPSRLVFVVSFSDVNGGVTLHPMAADWPLEVLNVLTFEESGGKTTLTIEGLPLHASEAERRAFEAGIGSMEKGFGGTMDQLVAFLANPKPPARREPLPAR